MSAKQKDNSNSNELLQEIEKLNKRLDLLDERLDNMDSVVSAVVERVMSQPVTMNITCPNCSKNIEIGIIGSKRPGLSK